MIVLPRMHLAEFYFLIIRRQLQQSGLNCMLPRHPWCCYQRAALPPILGWIYMYVVYYSYRIAMNILLRTLIGQSILSYVGLGECFLLVFSTMRECVYIISHRSEHTTPLSPLLSLRLDIYGLVYTCGVSTCCRNFDIERWAYAHT